MQYDEYGGILPELATESYEGERDEFGGLIPSAEQQQSKPQKKPTEGVWVGGEYYPPSAEISAGFEKAKDISPLGDKPYGFFSEAQKGLLDYPKSTAVATALAKGDNKLLGSIIEDEIRQQDKESKVTPTLWGKAGRFGGGLVGGLLQYGVSNVAGGPVGTAASFGVTGMGQEFLKAATQARREGRSIEDAITVGKAAAPIGGAISATQAAVLPSNVGGFRGTATEAGKQGAMGGWGRIGMNLYEQQLGLGTPTTEGALEEAGTQALLPTVPYVAKKGAELGIGKLRDIKAKRLQRQVDEIVKEIESQQKGKTDAVQIGAAEETDVGLAPGDRQAVVEGVPPPRETTEVRPVTPEKEGKINKAIPVEPADPAVVADTAARTGLTEEQAKTALETEKRDHRDVVTDDPTAEKIVVKEVENYGKEEYKGTKAPKTEPAGELLSPAEATEKISDFDQYTKLQERISQLVKEKKFTDPELTEAWRKSEEIKNRHGGMPPKPEVVTKSPVEDLLSPKQRPASEVLKDAQRKLEELYLRKGATPDDIRKQGEYRRVMEESETAHEALKKLVESGEYTGLNAELAKKLVELGDLGIKKKIGGRYYSKEWETEAAGRYDKDSDTVHVYDTAFLNLKGKLTFLHEYVHALTQNAIAEGRYRSELNQIFVHAYLRAKKEGLDFHGLSYKAFTKGFESAAHLHEFVAEVLSSPRMQGFLKETPSPTGGKIKTAWDAFVKWVAKNFDIKPDSALYDSLKISMDLAESRKADAAHVKPVDPMEIRGALDLLSPATGGEKDVATPKTEVQKTIEQGTVETPKPTEKPLGTGFEALKTVYRAAQKAGVAGKRAGAIEKADELKPVIADLRDQISNSITKAKALAENLRGQEKGSKLGFAEAQKQAAEADKWLAADSDNIRQSLVKLAGELPLKERGKFINQITQATKRPALFSKNITIGKGAEQITPVENMYRNAAKLAAKIDNRIAEVQYDNLVSDIRDFEKFKDSPSIDVGFRKDIRAMLDGFNALQKQGNLPIDALQALHDKLASYRDWGKSTQYVKEAAWQMEKDFAQKALDQQVSRPVETRPELRPQPGEAHPISMRIRNWVNNALNKASNIDKALLPIDALFDLMEDAKGAYKGWLFRHARGPIDLAYNNTIVRRNRLLKGLDDYVKQTGLDEKSGERIGVYAHNAQEGGRQRLIDMGLAPETIDKIVRSMTPQELHAYKLMRAAMDSQLPEVQSLMAKLYNTEVNPVENYFPMPRDWRVFEGKPKDPTSPPSEVSFDEMATAKALLDDYYPHRTTQGKKGFTIEREKGAKSPIKIDAFDIFRQHIQDVSHLIETQPKLKQLGEIGRSDEFRAKYGDVGQAIFLDWLDTVARQGTVESFKRWKLLDTIRKNTSVGIVGFRLSSQLVHESNVPYMYTRIGNWFNKGMMESFTERGRKFVEENFAETQERGGSEPAQIESEREGGRLFGIKVVPTSVMKISYAIARNLDRWNAQAGALGTYLRELHKKGIDWQNYDKIPIDRDAQALAWVLTRRAIASPAPKDVPQALSRGKLSGGNVSLGRTLFQFQNIFLDQWSNIRHDLWQAGIREKNPKLASQMFLAVLGATLLETGIKYGSKKAIQTVTGYQPPAKDDENAFVKKAIGETIRRLPFGGQIENQIMYGGTGIPSIDAITDISQAGKQVFTAKKEDTKARAAVKAVAGVAQLAGVPGASQVGELIEKSIPKKSTGIKRPPRPKSYPRAGQNP